MTKYMLATAAALALVIAPVASMAQGANDAGQGKSNEMKGPPNANGAKGDDAKSAGSPSSSSGDANGAASAKATGEDKK